MASRAMRERTWTGRLKTTALTFLMAALTSLTAWKLMGAWSLLFAGVLGVMAVVSLERSSLPARLRSARLLSDKDAPELYLLLSELSGRAGLARLPPLHLARAPAPNAATVGSRDEAAILLTPSLTQGLTERELAGVLAHEISHIRNNDLGLFRLTETMRSHPATAERVRRLEELAYADATV